MGRGDRLPYATIEPATGAHGRERICVYTGLFGGYEELTEQPVALESSVAFLCFTDDPALESATWTIRVVEPLLREDPVRSHRLVKVRAHTVLPDYDVSLYLDNSILLRRTPEEILAALFPADANIAAIPHSFRETVEDEFRAVVHDGRDRKDRCDEQERHYRAGDPASLALRPYALGLLLRRHNDQRVVAAMDRWFTHILRYSSRDQLSFRYVLREVGLEPLALDLDLFESDYHRWPVSVGRKQNASASPGEIGSLEARIEALELELASMRATRSWRWTRFARAVRGLLPPRRTTAPHGASSDSASPEPSHAATSR